MSSRFTCLAFTLVLIISSAVAGEKGTEGDERRTPPERGPDGLPKYRHPYTDGLYSTVTAMNTFPDLSVEKQKKIKLKVPGFKRDVPVYSIMQNYKAPLVVVLLGVDGKVDGPWGGLFPYWYNEYNYHVLTFDSSFTPTYPEICGQGVVGNFDAEADQAAAIIDTFLKTDEAKRNVTAVGVVGMSFGATQALLLGAKAKEGKLPFQLSGCLGISPPVKLRTSAEILDRFFAEDRWDTTMIELAKKFGPHVPVAEGQKIPFSATEMRAAIGFVFRDGLAKVVERNDRFYKLKVLPSEESGENRSAHAEVTGFGRFLNEFTYPYWQKKGTVKSADELWAMADLAKILPRLPDYADAIVAANDPFNTPEELAEAQAADAKKRLTVLPNGGHLGFIASDWMLVKSLRLFNTNMKSSGGSSGKPTIELDTEDNRTPDQARKEALDAAKEALKREVPPDPKKK
ncbi:MAG TPA: alpha/beta fold hydrolase [Planctomycetota bacterium]|nr:alpha/beta fold hydrolase [Planctomycetota bacterium]